MKNIDIKSLIIGGLLTTTIILGSAAVDKTNTASKKEQSGRWLIAWQPTDKMFNRDADGKVTYPNMLNPEWEPFAVTSDGEQVFYRFQQ